MIATTGMAKEKFSRLANRNQMDFETIYYDPESKIEILFLTEIFKKPGTVIIFENVTHPHPHWWLSQPHPKWWLSRTKKIPYGYCIERHCMNWGNGVLRKWLSEEEITIKALEGQADSELLVAVFQLFRDKENSEIDKIMIQNSISRDKAERKYSYKKWSIKQEYHSFTNEHFSDEWVSIHKPKIVKKETYDRPLKNDLSVNSKTNHDEYNSGSNSSSIFSTLISTAIEAYIHEKMGIGKSSYSRLSDDDLQRVQDAKRRGIQAAIRQRNILQQVQKNLSGPQVIYKNTYIPPPIQQN